MPDAPHDREFLSYDKGHAMIAIVLVVCVSVAGATVACWDDAANAKDLIILLATNAMTAIGTMVTGKK